MNIAVIGAGISGLSSAKLLQQKGYKVTVFEKGEKPGGLIRCDVINGGVFHRVGGHVFNTKNKEVLNWFWQWFDKDKEFLQAKRNAKIFMDNKYIGYPIENHIYQLEGGVISKIISELLELNKTGYKEPFTYASFEDFLKGNFGQTLYDLYFKPYNAKIWKTDLSNVALEWLEGKLPMPDFLQVFTSNIIREEEKNMVHSSFFYPVNFGSQFIVDRLGKDLKIVNDYEVSEITFLGSGWRINGDEIFDKVIYTGDVRKLNKVVRDLPNQVNQLTKNVEGLRSNGTSNLFCQTDDTDLSWLYLPDKNTNAHRIIYTGNFSKNNNPSKGRKTCSVEFSGNVTFEQMEREINKLPGNLEILDMNYEPNSYVIQNKGDREKIAALKNNLEPINFYLVGRFAEWEYYNMDKAIESAMKTTDFICNN